MKRLLFCISIISAMAVVPQYGFSQATGKLSGTIMDSSKKPLPFVTVRFFKQNNLQAALQTTLTNESGAFKFSKVDSGNYMLTFTHSGFVEKKQNITVKTGDDL
jgi:5-hydroxyisourate hydrolase-like protein (transthyretin family)